MGISTGSKDDESSIVADLRSQRSFDGSHTEDNGDNTMLFDSPTRERFARQSCCSCCLLYKCTSFYHDRPFLKLDQVLALFEGSISALFHFSRIPLQQQQQQGAAAGTAVPDHRHYSFNRHSRHTRSLNSNSSWSGGGSSFRRRHQRQQQQQKMMSTLVDEEEDTSTADEIQQQQQQQQVSHLVRRTKK